MPDPGPTIADIIAAAAEPGHAHREAALGAPSEWLVQAANKRGLDIAACRFTIDTSAVRHIKAEHGDETREMARGQLAITDADISCIGLIPNSPDKVVFGVTSKKGQPFIGYVKKMPDGWLSLVQEIRTGRRELATVTLYKHPATMDGGKIVANFRLDGRTDSGAELYIVDLPASVTVLDASGTAQHPTTINAAGSPNRNDLTDGGATPKRLPGPKNTTPPTPTWRRFLKLVPPALGILVLLGIVLGLHGALAKLRWRDIVAALAATPGAAILHAVLLLAASFCVMLIYDIPGILFARQLGPLPRLKPRRIALASFCAYALSHVLGAPALSAAAIRLRLYAQWQVTPAGIARIIALSGTAFILGAATLIGLLLLCKPHDIPLFGGNLSPGALRTIGALLLAIVMSYVLIAQHRPSLSLLGRAIPLPGRLIAAAQVALSCTDIALASAILFTVLPTVPHLSAAHVLAIYLAAFAGGLFSGLPAGIGVFDTLLLLGLSPYLPAAAAIGAILLFRITYFLVPAAIAGLCFTAHEILLTTSHSSRKR